MWGKTGINCFLMITGYFMCKSQITIKKFTKLILEVYFYKIVIFCLFLIAGYESLNSTRLLQMIMPVWGFNQNFTSCFIGFWLTIPFWNILIRNMSQKQHGLLILLLVCMYSILGNFPNFEIALNYVSWFGVIYLVSSYIRLYPMPCFDNKKMWARLTVLCIVLSMASVIFMQYLFGESGKGTTFFVSDANKLLAICTAATSFMWFKNLNIAYSKLINMIGGSTFGVLLIHANSDAMRQWLWKDTVDSIGHYSLPLWNLVGFSIGIILLIFFTCIVIDIIRIRFLEKPFFVWYDKKPRFQHLENFLTE